MTTYTIGNGYDTFAITGSTPTSANFEGSPLIIVGSLGGGSTNVRGFIYVPLPPDIIGQTIANATLTGHAAGSFVSLSVGLSAITQSWASATLIGTNPPSSTNTGQTSNAFSAGVGGAALALDCTAIIQAVASGGSWFGVVLNLTPTLLLQFNSFESGQPAWTLTIETTDAPEAPQALVPNGTVVGSGAPILTCDFTDNGGLSNDMAAMNVQVNATNVWTSPTYDQTGTTTVPVFNLASPPPGATAFTAISSGSSRFWRVRVQDTDGNWSGWSDGVQFTFRTQPTITVNTPAAGLVYDPTTDINATTSTNLSAYRVQITDGTDRTSIRFDSGRLSANPSALTTVDVPLPQEYQGNRVLVDSSTYQLHIRVWDTFTSRQSTPGSPAYVDSWSTFTFADDGTVTAPTTLTADQTDLGPSVTLTWTRAAAPDGWVILRDGKVINRSDGTDVIVGPSTYSWKDTHPTQWVSHTWTVKAISGGHQSHASPSVALTPDMENLWLYTQDGQQVFISNVDLSQLTVNDRGTSYKPINLQYDVDIVTGFEGVSGSLTGTILSDEWQDATAAQATLLFIKERPSTWVRMVYGTFSGRVLLRNVAVLPHPNANLVNQAMNVSFGVNHVGRFDSVV